MTHDLIALIKGKILTPKTSLDKVFSRYFNEDKGDFNGAKLKKDIFVHLCGISNPEKFYSEIKEAGYKIIDTKLEEQN